MPIVNGIDFPALEWCSILDGVLWIEYGRVPVDSRWAGVVHGNETEVIANLERYQKSLGTLYALVCIEKGVAVIGKPAVGIKTISHTQFGTNSIYSLGPVINCQGWGELAEIDFSKLREVGILVFFDAYKWGVLTDGKMYASERVPETAWAYNDVKVNFGDLSNKFPRNEVKNLRVGGDILLVKNKKAGRKIEYHPDDLLALTAAIFEDKADLAIETDAKTIEFLQKEYDLVYGAGNGPERTTIQNKVMTHLKAARELYRKADPDSY
jgi:hypothetical protein